MRKRHASQYANFGSLHIFWALIPKEFHYPDVQTAIQFAFDLKPRVCYTLNHKELPMGCHGFMHKSRMNFWKPFIPCIP